MRYLLMISMLLLFLGCSSEDSEADKRAFMKEYDGVRSESFGVTYYFSDSARVTAELVAEHIIEKEFVEPKRQVLHLINRGLTLNFLDARGRTQSYIKADSGSFDMNDRSGSLYGNVSMLNSNGETLETEELFWNEKKDSIFTDKLVRIETPDKIIIGKGGFRSNTEFSNYIIYGIEGEIQTEEGF
ncbi:MAG: LPS export ABC transporter periplasmic protein LptC [Bacteroidota bacterium]